jgi:hypothetical protein
MIPQSAKYGKSAATSQKPHGNKSAENTVTIRHSTKNIAGNAIDFFTQVEGKTFTQAMQIITEKSAYDPSERKIREERGNIAKTTR